MKKNDSRRKLLKSVAVGGGAVVAGKSLPESWSKPVINSVILPTHASTTDDTGSGGPEVTTTATPGETTTTLAPCLIEGQYCYSSGNNYYAITVGADGSIEVFFSNNNGEWDSSTSNDSVPVTGGSFAVTVLKLAGNGAGVNFRIISGDVVCNSTTIDNATFENQGGNVSDIFPSKDNCS